ncbi:MAG: 50S ribosomal protein L10 [Bacilli bacterium]|jgi:large subunit ribosomal protein L10
MNNEILKAKENIVKEVQTKMNKSQSVIVFEYRGLSVKDMMNLRRALYEVKGEVNVYKNSMLVRASENLGHKDLVKYLVGPNAYAFSEDIIAGPKVLVKFAKRNDKLVIKGGLIEGKVVDAKQISVIAGLPGREGLISMFLSVLQAPVRQFACAVKGIADKAN